MNSGAFTILEMTADRHELVVLWRVVQPFIANDSRELDLWCSRTDIPPP